MGVIADAWNAWITTGGAVSKSDGADIGELIEEFVASQTFLDLFDTPDDYTGLAGYLVVVNETEDGLSFAAPA